MDKSTAIVKVKLLLKLAKSAPEHEAAAATTKANDLISKFELAPAEYDIEEAKPLYTDDALLFEISTPVEWKAILALVIGLKYDCFVIQEKAVASTGDINYKYFVYGHDSDVIITKELFKFVNSQIDQLITDHCKDKDDLYVSSFGEGAVNGVRVNIEFESFNMPGLVKSIEETKETNPTAITKIDLEKKEQPIKEKVQVNNKEKPLNIIAYFTGESYGRDIHINGTLGDKNLTQNTIDMLNAYFDDNEYYE